MKTVKPIANKKVLLLKYPGKGGWTYAIVSGIAATYRLKGGIIKVKGSIDTCEIKKHTLFPLKEQPTNYFMPVKAIIRKQIKKEAGDYVHVVFYPDNEPTDVPDELLVCLQEEPEALTFFNSLPESDKHHYIKWIYSVKTEETKVERIAKSIDKLLKHQKFYDR